MEKLKALCAFFKKKPLYLAALLVILFVGGNLAMVTVEKFPHLACSPCHVMAPYVDAYDHSELLSHAHAQANVNCIDCHENGIEDKIQETVWYVTDDFDDPPYKRAFPNEMCTKCHSDIDAIVAKTDFCEANPHNSHLGDLVCSDCHKMHNQSRAKCADCHNFEFLQNLPADWDKEAKKTK